MKASVVAAREVAEEARSPQTAVAPVRRQVRIDAKRRAGGQRNDVASGFELIQLGVVFNAHQAFSVGALVLPLQRCQRAAKRWDEADAGETGNRSVRVRGMGCERSGSSGGGEGLFSPNGRGRGCVTGDGSRCRQDRAPGVPGDLATAGSRYVPSMGGVMMMHRGGGSRCGSKDRQRQDRAGSDDKGNQTAHSQPQGLTIKAISDYRTRARAKSSAQGTG